MSLTPADHPRTPSRNFTRDAVGDRGDVGALRQEGLEVALGDAPFFADLEAAQVAAAQPLGHGAFVHLQALSDLRRSQQLVFGHLGPIW